MPKRNNKSENEKYSEIIGERLKALRKKYGSEHGDPDMNMHDFGRAIGFECPTDDDAAMDAFIGKLERGDLIIMPTELQRYSAACGVSIDYIINGSDHVEPTKEFTFVDLCREIVNLDKCGLLDFVVEGNRHGITFTEIDDDEIYGDYAAGGPWRTINAGKQTISQFLNTFIDEYYTSKIKLTDGDLPRSRQLLDDAIRYAIENFEIKTELNPCPKSTNKILSSIEAARNDELPFD